MFYASTLVAFFTTAGMMLPLLVLLIPFAVIGVRDLLSHVRSREYNMVMLYSALVMFFGILALTPMREDERAGAYNFHAVLSNAKGFKSDATQYSERVSAPAAVFRIRKPCVGKDLS